MRGAPDASALTGYPSLFSCASEQGPVVYPDHSKVFPSSCTGFPTMDLLVFTGPHDWRSLPYLFSSTMLFMPCYRNFHVVTPEHDEPLLEYLLPKNMRGLKVHSFRPSAEFCAQRPTNRFFSFWKDAGQLVNLWADNYTAGADYILQLDSDTVFNYPVTQPGVLFASPDRPHLFYWDGVEAPWSKTDAALFGGPVEMQFMAKFPVFSTATLLQSMRKRLTSAFKQSLDGVFSQGLALSQFDMMGRAFVQSLGATGNATVHPCPREGGVHQGMKCRNHPHSMSHVSYPDKRILQGHHWSSAREMQWTLHPNFVVRDERYPLVATDIIMAGWCFGQTSEQGERHPWCAEHGLGHDVHPRCYDYQGMGKREHIPELLLGHKGAHWAKPLTPLHENLELVLSPLVDIVQSKWQTQQVSTQGGGYGLEDYGGYGKSNQDTETCDVMASGEESVAKGQREQDFCPNVQEMLKGDCHWLTCAQTERVLMCPSFWMKDGQRDGKQPAEIKQLIIDKCHEDPYVPLTQIV
uniref:Uncharacterized protein n=1 Tax=Eutreptiella gymnastica TaxID=73025 RepID=A0A7S1IKZ4_9EUGL|mmetsp:Transcript_2661/g.4746  ORF Transcript_2661/g.4746 Transcript_2661/m.4746 type:complete len:521 (+) Transcript_2661:132-1694(+)